MTSHKTVSDYKLEQYLLGELPENEIRAIRAEIEQNENLKQRMVELEKSNQQILEDFSPRIAKAAIEAKLIKEKREAQTNRSFFFKHSITIASFASLILVVAALMQLQQPANHDLSNKLAMQEEYGTERTKGSGPHIRIFKENNEESVSLDNGSLVREGDKLQIKYLPDNRKFGIIFSVDGNRNVTLHYPERTNLSTKLSDEQSVPLPYSYELDSAPEFETFYFITSNQGFGAAFIMSVARKAVAAANDPKNVKLDLPDNFNVYSIILKKTAD